MQDIVTPPERSNCIPIPEAIIDQEKLEVIHQVMSEEFGEEKIVSAFIFGSTARASDKQNSDYDFTLIVKDLAPDISEREQASPRMKKRLAELGIKELCAFNMYTPEEFQSAFQRKLWIIETMKTGYEITHDTDDFARSILEAEKPGVGRIEDRFAWHGVEFVEMQRFMDVIALHQKATSILQSVDSELAQSHHREAERIALVARLAEHGEAHSRGSIYVLSKRLNDVYGEGLDLDYYMQADIDHEMKDKRIEYGYDSIDRHLLAADTLCDSGQYTMSLSHTVQALRNTYLDALHRAGSYIINGEITQLFAQKFGPYLDAGVMEKIYSDSFKAEQLLGRSGFLSFDLIEGGTPYYEEHNNPSLESLRDSLKEIIKAIRNNPEIMQVPERNDEHIVTLIVRSGEDELQTRESLAQIDDLIFPRDQLRVIVEEGNDDLSQTVESIQLLNSEHIVILDSEVILSPLWLVNVLAGFKDESIMSVAINVHGHPDNKKQRRVVCFKTDMLRKAGIDIWSTPSAQIPSVGPEHRFIDGEPSYERSHLDALKRLSNVS
jgi:predicted nucleotidyltransferase